MIRYGRLVARDFSDWWSQMVIRHGGKIRPELSGPMRVAWEAGWDSCATNGGVDRTQEECALLEEPGN